MTGSRTETQKDNWIISRVEFLENAQVINAQKLTKLILADAEPVTVHRMSQVAHTLTMENFLWEVYMRAVLENHVVKGSLNSVSYIVRRFIHYASDLPGLQTVCVVNDLGFPDVWLVLSNLTDEQETKITKHCLMFPKKTGLEPVHFAPMSSERFACYGGEPLVELRFGA